MAEEETTTQEITTKSKNIIDTIFGGTKKAWIIITTIGIFISWGLGLDIPTEFFVLYSTVVGIYMGVGGVKMGMETQKKD